MTTTPLPNAFTINMLDGTSFPFTATCTALPGDVFGLSLSPVRVVDLCDLLAPYAPFVVFDVDINGIDPQSGWWGPSLESAAEELLLPRRTLDAQTLILDAPALRALLDEMSHYNLTAFDCPPDLPELELIDNVLTLKDTREYESPPHLPRLADARVFLDSHDDCYLYVQAYDLALLQAIFARTLQIYAGRVLAEERGYTGEIAGVPREVAERLWPMNAGLSILRRDTTLADDRVRIGVSPHQFEFGREREYPVTQVVEYDARTGVWRMTSA